MIELEAWLKKDPENRDISCGWFDEKSGKFKFFLKTEPRHLDHLGEGVTLEAAIIEAIKKAEGVV